MKKITLLGGTLATVLLTSITMAADFHALTAIKASPAPIQDEELSTIEGGAICHFQTIGSGVSICDVVTTWPIFKITQDTIFAADNGLPMSSGQFLQFPK